MKRATKIFEGKVNNVYNVYMDDEKLSLYLAEYEFTDRISKGDGAVIEEIPGKGETNALLSKLLFERLNEAGIDTHFSGPGTTNTSMLVWKCAMFPLEVVCRNVATGSFVSRYKGMVMEGAILSTPVVEVFLKNDLLKDPLIQPSAIEALGIATISELVQIDTMVRKVNAVAQKFFENLGLDLIDFKCEFGKDANGVIRVCGEFSQDTSRLWDTSGEHIDKDVFKKSNVLDEEEAVYRRMMQILKTI